MLKGNGIALGADENWQYEEQKKTGLVDGQIILIGTDGIWEARNTKGEMFGKSTLYEILRQSPQATAAEILDAIIEALNRFQEGQEPEDDVTLIVYKVGAIASP